MGRQGGGSKTSSVRVHPARFVGGGVVRPTGTGENDPFVKAMRAQGLHAEADTRIASGQAGPVAPPAANRGIGGYAKAQPKPSSKKSNLETYIDSEGMQRQRDKTTKVPAPRPPREIISAQRTKLGNQIQKGIREGKTPLPADPFQGFRDPAPDLDHLRRENAIPATPPKPNAEPRTTPTIKEYVERINHNIAENFRPDYDDEDDDDDPGRPTDIRSIPPDKLKEEIEYSRKRGEKFVTVKIPSYSEISLSMEAAMALDAHFEGDPQDMHDRRMARIAAGGGTGGVEGQKRVPAAGGAPNPRGGEWTK